MRVAKHRSRALGAEGGVRHRPGLHAAAGGPYPTSLLSSLSSMRTHGRADPAARESSELHRCYREEEGEKDEENGRDENDDLLIILLQRPLFPLRRHEVSTRAGPSLSFDGNTRRRRLLGR